MLGRLVLIVVALLTASCGFSRYTVMQETTTPANLSSSTLIYVGWLNLDERRYGDHNYSTPDEFRKSIIGMNGQLQKALREMVPQKRFVFASDPTTQIPPDVEMVIMFYDAIAENTAGGMNGHNGTTLRTTVKFFDHRAQREVKASSIQTNVNGMSGWAMYNLEACLGQTAYNVGVFISEKLAGGV
jgi:hypothetical protein